MFQVIYHVPSYMLAQNEQSMSTVTEMSTVSSKSIVTITAQIDINMENHDKDSIMMSSNQLQTILPVSVAILIVAVIFFIIFIRRVVYKKHLKPKKIEKEKIKVEQQTFKPYLIIDQNSMLQTDLIKFNGEPSNLDELFVVVNTSLNEKLTKVQKKEQLPFIIDNVS